MSNDKLIKKKKKLHLLLIRFWDGSALLFLPFDRDFSHHAQIYIYNQIILNCRQCTKQIHFVLKQSYAFFLGRVLKLIGSFK